MIPVLLQSYQCLKRSVSGFNWFIHLVYGCRDDRFRKNCLGTITVQQAQTVIDQPPERIIWCYSQWQPAYTQLLMMIPTIEFVKGIPTALEQDAYFSVNKRNLIVIDDQMIKAGKEKIIGS